MNCSNPECGENTIISEFLENGTVSRRCNKCGMPLQQQQPKQEQPVQTRAPLKCAPYQSRQVFRSPADVVSLAKSELKRIRTEIKRLRALEKQASELERLIAAATGKQTERGKVMPLRKQG